MILTIIVNGSAEVTEKEIHEMRRFINYMRKKCEKRGEELLHITTVNGKTSTNLKSHPNKKY